MVKSWECLGCPENEMQFLAGRMQVVCGATGKAAREMGECPKGREMR